MSQQFKVELGLGLGLRLESGFEFDFDFPKFPTLNCHDFEFPTLNCRTTNSNPLDLASQLAFATIDKIAT